MEADELLTAVRFPIWTGRTGFVVEELARRSGDFALVGVVCGVGLDSDGGPDRAAIALFGVGSTPVRATAAEAAVVSGASVAEAAAAAAGEIDPGDDLHTTGEYRKKVAAVLVERALDRAMEEARGA